MVLTVLVYKLKGLFILLLGLVKKSLCCFKRRRRLSCDSEPLTAVGVGITFETKKTDANDLQNWNSWEEPSSVITDLKSVQQHIDYYRQQQQSSRRLLENPPDQVQNEDFFQDMTPKIIKQPRVFVKPQGFENQDEMSSRLSFAHNDIVLPPPGPELGSWEENEGTESTWADAEEWDITIMVREKRRIERERKVAMKKNEKEHSRITLGAKRS
uniref:Receptor-binding cancer antigen expressed on SiSo cells n=1 Tax=Clastoptera arizonana TaxID=38151 RepID=A0A1B6CFX1_9HEMI